MQSTGHSSTQARSLRSTHGWAITYVTASPSRKAPHRGAPHHGAIPSVWNAHSVVSLWPDSRTIGCRVVVRYLTGRAAPSGRPELTDVVGHVRAVAVDAVEIERRDGSLIRIQRADVVTWKLVPDPPQRRTG